MKNRPNISKIGLITYWAQLPWCLSAQTQDLYSGMWEGNFMEQFKTVILLDQLDGSGYAGKIIMYSGENRTLSFYIAAKESSFKGTFNEMKTELSGNFIFPDNTNHPLTVRKFEKDSAALEATAPPEKERLKLNFPAEELKSEFRELIDKLKKYHPRLYSYTSEVSFDNQVKEILSNINSDLGIEEYYLRIAPLIASVECSHTGIRLPREYQQSNYEHALFFPLELYVCNNKAYCLSAPASPGVDLAPGSEIRAINNRPVSEIIEELLARIPSEGNCMSTKYQVLNRDFHTYFHLLDHSDRFLVEYSLADAMGSVQLEACSYDKVRQRESSPLPMRPYSFHRKSNPEFGVLEVSSFGIRNMEEYFAFLDSTFLFIGEEPGSSFLCNDMSIQLKLPNTGMEVNIPRTTFVTAVSGFSEEEPFLLDYDVDISVQDLLSGTDTYKTFVYELVNGKNQLVRF